MSCACGAIARAPLGDRPAACGRAARPIRACARTGPTSPVRRCLGGVAVAAALAWSRLLPARVRQQRIGIAAAGPLLIDDALPVVQRVVAARPAALIHLQVTVLVDVVDGRRD